MANKKHILRSTIIFDASNFYFKLKSLDVEHKSSFDYLKFSQWLTKGSTLTHKYYAVGKIEAIEGDEHSQKMMSRQQEIIAKLRKSGFITQYGYLLRTKDNKYHEKGVDVQLAVDIMKGAYKNTYDICYLVSSDTDLIPAIKEEQSAGKKVIYVGFRHQVSYALHNQCKAHILLTKSDLSQFVKWFVKVQPYSNIATGSNHFLSGFALSLVEEFGSGQSR